MLAYTLQTDSTPDGRDKRGAKNVGLYSTNGHKEPQRMGSSWFNRRGRNECWFVLYKRTQREPQRGSSEVLVGFTQPRMAGIPDSRNRQKMKNEKWSNSSVNYKLAQPSPQP
jgi:hypothetical protein